MHDHLKYMKMVLDLAGRAKGNTWPNPMVGAVVVSDGAIVGQGYHKKAGMPHAEAEALSQAKDKTSGAVLFVNLEPCCHCLKRTPPCTQAIIKAGIKTVVYAMDDPNPKVRGIGIKQLNDAGIETIGNIMEKEARGLNEVYQKYMTTGFPFSTLKLAMSLDGKIALPSGKSRGLSCEESLKQVHQMRLEAEAVMVGSGTVIKDDPELTVRLVENPDQRQPTRFIIDSTLRSSVNAKVFDQSLAKTVLVTTDQADKDKKDQLDGNGVEIWNIRTQTDGKIDLKELLRVMGLHEYCNLLVEGGSRLGTSMLKAGLIDKLCLFFTPNIIGGDGLSSIAELGLTDMSEAYKIKDLKCRQVGCDILMEAYPENK